MSTLTLLTSYAEFIKCLDKLIMDLVNSIILRGLSSVNASTSLKNKKEEKTKNVISFANVLGAPKRIKMWYVLREILRERHES